MTTPDPHSHDTQLDALVARYIEAIERGETPDREKLIAENPALADGLRSFFTDYDRLQLTNLQPAAHQVNPEATFIPQHETQPGTIFGGRYKLLQNIGEGGMGSVWVAEQKEPVKRKVAIKLVKAGMDSKQVLARFEAERQALAMMDHPNIAKVFDGGITEHGRPYFVMEYVKGVPFTEYCDKARLSLKERLNLFIPVCQAVQHAHHKGIVHRDLKPSNILICLYDGKPVPKVIDFGLAKAMHQQLTEQSIFTAHGVMVGTPLYMSPEQAEHNNLDVDTRTDIYSLGVVLYELLTGTTPMEREQLRTAAYNEVLRLIKEVEPPRPSTRLSGSDSLPRIAAQRSIDPRHLQKSVAGDLDWIVMKSLEKERSRRYETATSFARDIERFLNDEAVEACPPSLSYRLRKYVRRHKPQVIAMSLILSTLLIAIAATTWGWRKATDAAETVKKSLENVMKERDAKNAALEAKSDALNEKTAALSAEAAARVFAERQMLDGLLRSIGFGDVDSLDFGELRCFVDLAAISDSHLKLRVLEVAFEKPDTALRIARRADRVAQTCVTLSPARRTKAVEFLSAQQRRADADPRIRIAAARLALELGSSDLVALPEALTLNWLDNPTSSNVDPHEGFTEFIDFITSRVDRLSPDDIKRGWDALIAVLEKSTHWPALQAAGNGLVALAPKLSAEQSARGADAIIAVLENSTDYSAHQAANYGLVALTPKLSPEQITLAWDALIAVLEKPTEMDYPSHVLIASLIALAPKLDPEQITRGGDALIGVLEKTEHWNGQHDAAGNGLVVLAKKLSPEQITRGWDAIIGVLEKSRDANAIVTAGEGMVALAPMLNTEQTTRGGNALIAVLEKSTDGFPVLAAGNGLVALAPKLGTEQISRGGDALIGMLETSTDRGAIEAAVNSLVALGPKLSSEQLKRGWDALIAILEKSTDSAAQQAAGNGLVALAPKLNHEQLSQGWDVLIGVLEKSNDYSVLKSTGHALVALVPELSPAQITRGWDSLIGVLEKSTDSTGLQGVGNGLAALAPKLSPAQITRGGDALIVMLEEATNQAVQEAAGNGLVALAPTLSAAQIMRCRDAMIVILEQSTNDSLLVAAANGLAALGQKLSSDQLTRGGDALIAVLEKTTHWAVQEAAGSSLVAMAPKLSNDARIRTAETMVASLCRVHGGGITEPLLDLLPHLERPTQDRVAAATMTILLDYRAVSENYFYGKGGQGGAFAPGIDLAPLRLSIMANADSRSLSAYLQHPACTGQPRDWMLQRFEELVFHNGERVFLPLPKSEGETVAQPVLRLGTVATPEIEHGGLTPNSSPAEPPARRFHAVHDAAAWIQQNWPDFDLEATHPVTWRGEM